ncbi:neutral zinc metallopeptidase [uncultured Roseobacter sp.]|uniref:KPN_02809 family neutral zinc metallopeptidase n=1 Tax=uncultured Roseobacter sp. TaxID=114847 RepID=UPI0026017821|nr:neutral zinc metallopeptidase [uncultured Roseobacter sp.]
MRLRGIRSSRNVSVRRGSGRRGARTGGLSLAGLVAVLAIGYFTGIDVSPLLQGTSAPTEQSRPATAEEDAAIQFSAQVLTTTEEVWSRIFAEQLGREYAPPQLIIFSAVTQSACGGASGATGPFYCPADQSAYLDTQFFVQLDQQLGARGDFAAAYVIAHEVAHHVQNQLGILPKVDDARRRANQADANALTVRLELQADCLSGVWARSVQGLMERGDLEEALNAARMIGDDHLQRQTGRVPQPHTFTHGTSEQRARWFERGFDSGQIGSCDTFGAQQL